MGWFRRRGPIGSRCDCCNSAHDPFSGYFLPTIDVVISERYWIHVFTRLKTRPDAANLNEAEWMAIFYHCVLQMAGQTTAWSICDSCSEFFVFDRQKARTYAAAGKQPPDTGKVRPGVCAQYAAQGFEQVFGFWPSATDQSAVVDTCAFCRKKIYVDEICSYITEEVLTRHRASGIIDSAPVRPPQPHDGGMAWSMCTPCAARMLARSDRAQPEDDQAP